MLISESQAERGIQDSVGWQIRSHAPRFLCYREKRAQPLTPHLPRNIYMVCVCEGVFAWCHLGERKAEQTVDIWIENKQ